MSKTLIQNAKIVTKEGVEFLNVQVKDGYIRKMNPFQEETVEKRIDVIDAQGQLLIPGMIDVHIHGANGFDMMDGTEESILEVSKTCAKTGCTTFLPTSVTSSLDDLLRMIRNVKQVIGHEPGAKIAGIHLEGPYLHKKHKGMQNEKYLRNPNMDEMKEILKEADGLVKMVTIAPELPGGLKMVEFLKEQGIIVSIAHSNATYEEAKLAFEKGASHITHCFNAMPSIHHRNPGLLIAAFEESTVSLQAIVDNIHLHPAIVRFMHHMKGSEKMVLITDALQAMNLGDGNYSFGGHNVTVKNGKATLSDGTLASSTVTMNDALQNTAKNGIPLADAIEMTSSTPASILDLENKGKIAVGNEADLVLLDDNFDVIWTMIEGSRVTE